MRVLLLLLLAACTSANSGASYDVDMAAPESDMRLGETAPADLAQSDLAQVADLAPALDLAQPLDLLPAPDLFPPFFVPLTPGTPCTADSQCSIPDTRGVLNVASSGSGCTAGRCCQEIWLNADGGQQRWLNCGDGWHRTN